MTDLWRLPATEIAARVRARDVSAAEVARDALARLEAANPAINAVVAHSPEQTLAEAAAVDAALARGEDPGPMAGVPVTVKVNVDQAGWATTNGLRIQRDLVAEHDSPVVSNLRRAGAVVLGRTNTPAFSLRWFTRNGLHGAHPEPARSLHHAGRLLGRRGGGRHRGHRRGGARHRYRRLHPLPRLCLRRPWAAPDPRPRRRLQRLGAGARDRRAAHGGVRPPRAHHRRPSPGARRDEPARPARPVVDAGAARRPARPEARRALHRAGRHGGAAAGRGGPARRGAAPRSRGLDRGGGAEPAAAGRAGAAPAHALAGRDAAQPRRRRRARGRPGRDRDLRLHGTALPGAGLQRLPGRACSAAPACCANGCCSSSASRWR